MSQRSTYTPPIVNASTSVMNVQDAHSEKRASRSPIRNKNSKRRRRSSALSRRSKQHRCRSRSRHSSLSSGSLRRTRGRRRRQSRRYKDNKHVDSSSSSSSSSSTSSSSSSSNTSSADSSSSENTTLSTSMNKRKSRSKRRSTANKRKRGSYSRSDKIPFTKRRRSTTRDDHERDFLQRFAKILNNNRNSSFDGAHHVIPEFNPDAKTQTAADWLRKVNQTATIYGWSEKQIIYHAIPKLTGYAKKWYQARNNANYSWDQWQRKILTTFPDDRNYADRLYEMLDRKSGRDESLEEYYHDKARLVKMCGIKGRNAVDCIINGIFDNNIRFNAQGYNFKRPTQLLRYLRRISKKTVSGYSRKLVQGFKQFSVDLPPSNNRNTSTTRNYSTNVRSRNVVRCYNCSEWGHTVQSCTKPIKKCDKCSRLGHIASECRSNSKPPMQNPQINERRPDNVEQRKVLQITEDQQNSKYFKTAKLNDNKVTAYIDFGSQCTLIRSRVATESHLALDKLGLPVIKGFAQGSVVPLGRVVATIEVDAVKADINAYVVNDDLLFTDILIGQTLTELPSVIAIKTDTELKLYCDSVNIVRYDLVSSLKTNTTDGIGYIEVNTVGNDYTGPLFIPGNVCMKQNSEYSTIQGVYQFNCGKGRILVLNLSGNLLQFPKDKIIARAVQLPNLDQFSSNFQDNEIKQTVSDSKAVNLVQLDKCERDPITAAMVNVGPKVSLDEKLKLINLLNEYRHCFAFNMQELGLTNITEMTIRLNDDTPVTYKPYRLPYSERAVVRQMISELLANDIIKESHSAYASPIVLVRKKNNDYRLCVDYRALNKKTIKDSYPMPVIDDQLDRLSGKSFFTSLDLASGYYQIPVSKSSQHLTAFVTPDGHYEYTRMPFGLVNAPAVFQNMINKALGNRRFDLAVPYLDDLLSVGSTIEEAIDKLKEILKLISTAGLTLNLKKCNFLQSEIDYLGYEISETGLRPGNKKIQAVAEFPVPQNVHQVRQFVGLASFFRRFIFNFATIARPLTKLTKADFAWQWNEEQELAFQELKSRLVSRPVLALYNPQFHTEVHCDASKFGVGGVLLQKAEPELPLRPVAYFSRQTTREEEFWHSHELETIAVVASLQKFRVYLIGLDFKVVTDCNALRTTLTKRDLLPKVARWWLILQEFSFNIEYRPGNNMQHVDALSRNPVLPPSPPEELEVLQISTDNWLNTVQVSDPRLKHIKMILDTSVEDLKDITENYVSKEGRIYRKVGRKLKWVVPHGARWRICQLNHDEAGHFSLEKTVEKIKADYWFPKMNRFIKKYVSACINCAYNKEMARKNTGYLHPIPKGNTVFHTIHMDHLGPFIRSKRGNSYILGIIDGFSKFIIVKAVKNTKSKTTIKILEDLFATFSCPRVIVSDQGSGFTSSEFKRFVDSSGIKHVRNAVATPRANGQIERYNRTILNSLAAMNHGLDEKDWDLNISKLQWSLNNTINRGIDKTPAEVVFGYRTTGQTENLIRGEVTEPVNDNLEKERQEIRNTVEENIIDKQNKMKEAFDKTRAPTKIFKTGDLVMIPNHNPEKGKSKKLAPKFRGPFKITQVLDKDRYVVSSIEGHTNRKYENTYPADQLKPWITFHSSPHNSSQSDSSSDDSAIVEIQRDKCADDGN